MNNYIVAVISYFCFGAIDVIEGGMAHVILTKPSCYGETIYEADMPVQMFPCEISEGDVFYIQTVDGVTEIRCGEPE